MDPKSAGYSHDRKPFSVSSIALELSPLVTAVLLCISLSTGWGTGLCFIALIPFACVLLAPKVSRATYASAYLAGLAIHLVGMSWVLDCYRYDRLVGPYAVQWFWIGTWGGALLVLLFAVGRAIISRWRLPVGLVLPILWVAYEFIRHEMADIATGTGFPWLKLGTTLVDSQYLVQVADLGGEYLLSFLVAMINGAILDMLLCLRRTSISCSRRAALCTTCISSLVVLSSFCYGVWRSNQSVGRAGPAVVLMGELDLPPILQAERLESTTHGRHADLLLWPELAFHHAVLDVDSDAPVDRSSLAELSQVSMVRNPHEKKARRYLQETAHKLGSTLVIGCERVHITAQGSTSYNSMACADSLAGFQGCYDKMNLVPGAETEMRSAEVFDASEFSYGRGKGLRVFQVPTSSGVYCAAPAVCYDLCFGQHFRSRTARDADFLVQCGAEGQDENDVVAWLMLRYAKLRAIENRRAIVRNATFGYSGLIDGNGVVQAALSTEPITSPTWLGKVPIDDRWSLYARAGDWIAYVACLATICLAFTKPTRH